MITLKQKLEILFANEQDQIDMLNGTETNRTTVIRGCIRDVIKTSSALGLADLEEETLGLTEVEMATGVPVIFDLLQVIEPITIRATCVRYGDVGSNYVNVVVKVNLAARKASYSIEHPVCEVHVDSVSLPRLYKRLERILKDVPSIVAPLLAN